MKKAAAMIAAVHLLLLAAYTVPPELVPLRLRYWSQAYARVPFHQDWRLFAPDPPACGCILEVNAGGLLGWRSLDELHDHFIWRRMCANACRYAEALAQPGDSIAQAPLALSSSLENMAADLPQSEPIRFRFVRACAGEEFTAVEVQTR